MGVAENGGSTPSRSERLARQLPGLGVDALLVETPVNVRYLTGFSGSNGLVLLLSDQAAELGPHRFLTDFRYTTQAQEQVREEFDREVVAGELLEALAPLLAAGPGRLGFDESSFTVKAHRRLREMLAPEWELIPLSGAVERLRAVKEASELERIAAASQLADQALTEVLEGGLAGRTEREVAVELELRMRRLGAESPSFPSIVAAGPHGALPHAQPRDVVIARDVLVTIDWGALHEGYCSDCTRTFATGEGIDEAAREVYALVLEAQECGLGALRAGRSGREVDAAARAVIEQGGQGEHFGHGLGHGVGLEIHEAPRLSRQAPQEPLVAGNVVTVEPGVYLPGSLGVRIEDLAVVEDGGCAILTALPKALTAVP